MVEQNTLRRFGHLEKIKDSSHILRDERQVLGRHVRLVEALKVELVRLQRELIASQNKRASLEAEIIRREKCHRWTTLKVTTKRGRWGSTFKGMHLGYIPASNDPPPFSCCPISQKYFLTSMFMLLHFKIRCENMGIILFLD